MCVGMKKEHLLADLKTQGFSDNIIRAFESVRREDFVLPENIAYAYYDEPLPIGKYSTISQPSTIAFMLNLMKLGEGHRVLEIGSGCGYVLALMSELTKQSEIFGLEIDHEVCSSAITRMSGYENVHIYCMDGKNGLPEHAPFDRILISAACQGSPRYLLHQLKGNGIIVASVLDSVIRMIRSDNVFKEEVYPGFRFVPLI